MDLQMDVVLGVFQQGWQDPENIEVRLLCISIRAPDLSARSFEK